MNNHKILIALLGILTTSSAPSCCTQAVETTQTTEFEDTASTPVVTTDYDSDAQMQNFIDNGSENAEINNSLSEITTSDSMFDSDILPDTDYNSASETASDAAADENSLNVQDYTFYNQTK
ncbi:MAG: hypothetical protein QG632_627 [Candidatus Dependentiae bacterium]|nr:hypothetical protein [Candidatus Dependentiae bacterium]